MNIAIDSAALLAIQGPGGPPPQGGLSGVFSGTPWIDLVGFMIIGLFLALGIRHGLVWQVTRLIGMVIAVALARSLSPEFTPHVASVLSLPTRACQGIVWFLTFAGTLGIAAMIGVVGRRALEAVQLGPMDRMGGALAGALTGVIVHCAVLVLLSSIGTTAWTARTLKGSASASMLDNLSRKSHLLLDAQAAERIVEPWGQAYDAERYQAQQIEVEMQRRESARRAAELRREAAEEERRAKQLAAPQPSYRNPQQRAADAKVR